MKRPCELNIFLFLDPLPNNFVVVSAHKVITISYIPLIAQCFIVTM
jgi:hypothetical protein